MLTESFPMTCFFASLSMINLLVMMMMIMMMMMMTMVMMMLMILTMMILTMMMMMVMMTTYSSDKFKRLPSVVPRALDQSAVVQEKGVVGSNLK